MPDHGLTTLDDTLHPPTDPDPWWTETAWFPFFLPDQGMFGNWYAWFRPNLGISGGGLRVFDDTAVLPWEVPFNQYHRALRLDPRLDLRDADLGEGLWLRAIEPTRAYAFGLTSTRCTLDLRWEACTDPVVRRPSPTPPFRGGHHVDQIGRVTGSLVLDGTTYAVDCLSLRDRSWGPRSDRRGVKAAYDWAFATPDEGFLALSMDRRADDADDRVVHGFVLRDGVLSPVTGGRRVVARRPDGLPAEVRIEITDELGRTLTATGTTTARSTEMVQPPMLLHQSLTAWSWDRHTAWGEDEDVWDPDRWRARRADGSLR